MVGYCWDAVNAQTGSDTEYMPTVGAQQPAHAGSKPCSRQAHASKSLVPAVTNWEAEAGLGSTSCRQYRYQSAGGGKIQDTSQSQQCEIRIQRNQEGSQIKHRVKKCRSGHRSTVFCSLNREIDANASVRCAHLFTLMCISR